MKQKARPAGDCGTGVAPQPIRTVGTVETVATKNRHLSRKSVIEILLQRLADELVRHDTAWSQDPYSRKACEHRGAAAAYRSALYFLRDEKDQDEIDALAERLWPARMDDYIALCERVLPTLKPDVAPFLEADIAAARALARDPGRPAGAKRVS